jgi:hypothetical protein
VRAASVEGSEKAMAEVAKVTVGRAQVVEAAGSDAVEAGSQPARDHSRHSPFQYRSES